ELQLRCDGKSHLEFCERIFQSEWQFDEPGNIGRQLRLEGGDTTRGPHDQRGLLRGPSPTAIARLRSKTYPPAGTGRWPPRGGQGVSRCIRNQILIAAWKLPDAICPPPARIRGLERHQFHVLRRRRKVEQAADRPEGSTKGRVLRDIRSNLAIGKDLSPIFQ